MFKGELSVRERTVQEKEKRGWGGRNELSKHVVPFRPPSAMISRVFRNVSCTPKSVSWLLPDRIYDGHAAPPPPPGQYGSPTLTQSNSLEEHV